MQLSPEQVQQILEDAKPSIIEGLKKEIVQSVRNDLQDTAAKMIRAEVEKFIAAEVIPEVQKRLIENKDGLISLAIPASELIVEALAKHMAETLKKNLEQSWSRSEILKKLFQ